MKINDEKYLKNLYQQKYKNDPNIENLINSLTSEYKNNEKIPVVEIDQLTFIEKAKESIFKTMKKMDKVLNSFEDKLYLASTKMF